MLLGKLVVTEHNNTSTTSIQASSKKNVGNGGNLRTLWLVIIKCFLDGVVDTLILAAEQLQNTGPLWTTYFTCVKTF